MQQVIQFFKGQSLRIQVREHGSSAWNSVMTFLHLEQRVAVSITGVDGAAVEYGVPPTTPKQPLEQPHLPPASPNPLDQHQRHNKQLHGSWYAEWTVVATQCKRGAEQAWYAVMKGAEVYVHHYEYDVTASELLLDAENLCSGRNQAKAITLPAGFEFSDTPGPADHLGRSLSFDLDDSSFDIVPLDTTADAMGDLNLRWIVPIGYKGQP